MGQFAIYKGHSAKFGGLQFDLGYPTEQKKGAVFVNACSATGPNVYDWENKIVLALGVTDIGKILHFMVSAAPGGNLSLVHDPNMKGNQQGKVVKTMQFYTKDGVLGGMMVTVSSKQENKTVSHKIPMSGDEVIILKNLLESAIVPLLQW